MKIYGSVLDITKKIQSDSIFVYAAHISFYIIISAIPFIMVLLSSLEYILPLWDEEIFDILLPPIPSAVEPLLKSVSEELFNRSTDSVLPLSAISLLWTASRGIAAAERGVRRIYQSPVPLSFIRSAVSGICYTILFIAAITFILAAALYTELISYGISNSTALLFRRITGSGAASFISLTLILCLIYTLFCGKKISPIKHMPGAIFTTVANAVFSSLYSFYIDNFGNYSYIYGSLTALVLLLLWIYFSMIIFLFGAELNTFLISGFFQRTKNRK